VAPQSGEFLYGIGVLGQNRSDCLNPLKNHSSSKAKKMSSLL